MGSYETREPELGRWRLVAGEATLEAEMVGTHRSRVASRSACRKPAWLTTPGVGRAERSRSPSRELAGSFLLFYTSETSLKILPVISKQKTRARLPQRHSQTKSESQHFPMRMLCAVGPPRWQSYHLLNIHMFALLRSLLGQKISFRFFFFMMVRTIYC